MRRFIGKEHCCAEMVNVKEFIVCKKMSENCDRIIEIIDRITLQLAELSLSFKCFKNTRVIYLPSGDMTLFFYYYNDHFYVSSQFSIETMQISKIIRTIVEDTELPLFRSVPKLMEEELYEDIFKEF